MHKKITAKSTATALTALLSLSSALLLALSGCGGGGGGSTPTPPPSTTLARFAYVANHDDNTLSVFIADNTTGQLRHHGYTMTGDGPTSLTLDPSGQFAYTTNDVGSDISLFTIDSLSGELTAADCNLNTGNLDTCSTANGVPSSLVFEPNGLHAYVANNDTSTITTFDKDPATGALTLNPVQPQVTADGLNPLKLMVHGGFLYATYAGGTGGVGVYEISATDGTIQAVAGSPSPSGGTAAVDIAFTPDGQYAYVANSTGEIGAFTIDASGVLVTNGSVQSVAGTTPQALAIDSSGQWLYMLSRTSPGSISAFQIQSDGTLTQINCGGSQNCATGNLPASIAIDPTGQFVSVTNGGDNTLSLFSINQTSGQLTALRGLASRNAPAAVAYYSDTAAVTVTPRFAYVANASGNSVSA
ncbi:MAG: beta-propeller fold lactonase family protein [Candidatus Thiodiazotropha sp.]